MPYRDVSLEEMTKAYLDPHIIHGKMLHIGFFMFAFEMLRQVIHERPQSFFSDEWSFVDGEMRTNRTQKFKEQVLSLAKREFEASLRWHVNEGALTDDDLQDILVLLEYRNLLAHEPHKIMDVRLDHFQANAADRVRKYHFKISNYWARVEMGLIADLPEDVEVDESRARSILTDILDYYAEVLATPIIFQWPNESEAADQPT